MEKHQKIAVHGFLVKDGKVLITKRSEQEKLLPGYYDLPGGKIECGEKPEAAVKREYLEETGLRVEVIAPYNTFSWVSEEIGRHTVEIDYIVKPLNPISGVKLDHSHTAFAWITENEMDKYKLSPEAQESIHKGFAFLKAR